MLVRKNFLFIVTIFTLIVFVSFLPMVLNLTGTIGLSGYWAKKAADAIFAGLAFWQIAGLLAGAGGIFGLGVASAVWAAKWMIRRLGQRAFIAF